VNNHAHVLRPKRDVLLDTYLIEILNEMDLSPHITGVTVPKLNQEKLRSIEIPLPPLAIQQEIVAEIESYQKIIDGARQVVENYRPRINVQPEWPKVELGVICDVRDGTHDSPKFIQDGYPLITSKNLRSGEIDFQGANLISKDDLDAINQRSRVDEGDILMPMIGTIGNPVIAKFDKPFAIKNVALIKFYSDSRIDRGFLKALLGSMEFQAHFEHQASGSTQRFIPLGFIRKLGIPVPALETQRVIVAEIEAEQVLVMANKQLIERFESKIKATINRAWCSAE
jgi:restriction endonuclease S subunit